MLSSVRLAKFGIPALVVLLALAAGMAWWTLNANGPGTGANATIKTNIEWKLFDPQGVLKSQGVGHNFTTANLINDARSRLSTATTTDASLIYSNIALCSTASGGTAATTDGGTVTSTCTLSTNEAINPALATVTNTTQGVYTAVKTFTATGASTINQISLSKNLVSTTTPATTDMGALKAVTIVLASGDTLQVTWTVTVQ